MRASFSFTVVTRMQDENSVGDTIPIQKTYHILKGDDKSPEISIKKSGYKSFIITYAIFLQNTTHIMPTWYYTECHMM